MKTKRNFILFSLMTSLLLISSCSKNNVDYVKVILEEGDYRVSNHVLTGKKGDDFSFIITMDIDKMIYSSSYENYSIDESIGDSWREDIITFHNVNYSTVITLTLTEACKINYISGDSAISTYINKTHERVNTSIDYSSFQKDGYSLIGYRNEGSLISVGSRVSINDQKEINLNAIYSKESNKDDFIFAYVTDTRLKITKYIGHDSNITIPQIVDNKQIIAIDENAFIDLDINQLVIAKTVAEINKNAFKNCQINELVFYDNISLVSDDSFQNTVIKKIRINSTQNPAYIRTYYGTYADKFDRLLLNKNEKKLVLYSGSSTRFGFESESISKVFTDYKVINMGVFAYTPSYPQIDILSKYMNDEDVCVISPEFDALEYQMELSPTFDSNFIAMCEANYDILSDFEFDKYQSFFSAFNEFQYNRRYLNRYEYTDSPSFYDEDGNKVTSSYNKYGDYIVPRPNNINRISFGIKRAFYNKKYFPTEMINSFNDAIKLLSDKGVTIFYDYSPRSNISISSDSNEQSINELGEYLSSKIDITFISSIQESLVDPYYFYKTDNHLSTDGVKIRTDRVIERLLQLI